MMVLVSSEVFVRRIRTISKRIVLGGKECAVDLQ